MSTGTNYRNGISYRVKYSGNVDTTNNYERRAKTKPVFKQATIRFEGADAAGEYTTGLVIKAPFMIRSAGLITRLQQSSISIDLGGNAASGAGDDPNLLITGQQLQTDVDLYSPARVWRVVTGSNESYFAAPQGNETTYVWGGVGLGTIVAGSDVTTDVGTMVEHPFIGAVDMPVTITTGSAITGKCEFLIEYIEFVQEDK